jgi:MSHA pilin protein MshD
MNTGQTILTMGALILFSTLMVTMNTSYQTSGELVIQSELGITASSLGTSLIEEAISKAFDKSTDTAIATSLSFLTPSSSLGPDDGEMYPHFNDFDDYNKLTLTQTIEKSGVFTLKSRVMYVAFSNMDASSSAPTWNKKISVQVTCKEMKDTINMDYIFSYWYFR